MQQILIVDDSPTIRRMVKTSLLALPASPEFVEAGSGLEAIERLGHVSRLGDDGRNGVTGVSRPVGDDRMAVERPVGQ